MSSIFINLLKFVDSWTGIFDNPTILQKFIRREHFTLSISWRFEACYSISSQFILFKLYTTKVYGMPNLLCKSKSNTKLSREISKDVSMVALPRVSSISVMVHFPYIFRWVLLNAKETHEFCFGVIIKLMVLFLIS